jgi:hypothetical protein
LVTRIIGVVVVVVGCSLMAMAIPALVLGFRYYDSDMTVRGRWAMLSGFLGIVCLASGVFMSLVGWVCLTLSGR